MLQTNIIFIIDTIINDFECYIFKLDFNFISSLFFSIFNQVSIFFFKVENFCIESNNNRFKVTNNRFKVTNNDLFRDHSNSKIVHYFFIDDCDDLIVDIVQSTIDWLFRKLWLAIVWYCETILDDTIL
ncbi:hypothetical protein SSS_05223 [Sarcoptes scabiei]|nr:hypothetical protein SSS_05223 [Sarcoptes scabiei]